MTIAWTHADTHVNKSEIGSAINSSRTLLYAAQRASGDSGAGQASVLVYKPVGLIQAYNWSEQKQVEMIFELGSDIPYLVPGRTTGQLGLTRMLLHTTDIINVLYDSIKTQSNSGFFSSLKQITDPINLMFVAFKLNSAEYISRIFEECWITARNESISAGQVVVAENVNILYTNVGPMTNTLIAQTDSN